MRIYVYRSSSKKLDDGYILEHPYVKNGRKVIAYSGQILRVDKNTQIYLGNYINFDSNGKFNVDENKSLKFLVGLSILREKKIEEFKNKMKFPYSSVVLGLTIGYKEDFPERVDIMIRKSGLAHVFVVSGYNVQLFLEIIRKFFSKFGKSVYLLISINFLLFYLFVVGLDAPIVRASFMGLFTIIGYATGRYRVAIYTFFLTVGFLISYYPAYSEDVGFLLSSVSTYAVLFFNTYLSNYFSENSRTFVLTLLVNLFILPVTAFYFGTINLMGLISGPLSSFVVELVTILGFFALLFEIKILFVCLIFLCDHILNLVEISSSVTSLTYDSSWMKNNFSLNVFLFLFINFSVLLLRRYMKNAKYED